MKKNLIIIPLALAITACKPTTQMKAYGFNHFNEHGIKVSLLSSESKFDISFSKKYKRFSFSYFRVGDKTIRYPDLLTDFTFADSVGETITFDNDGFYNFEKVINERTISVQYDETMGNKLQSDGVLIELEINGFLFTNFADRG